MNTILEPKKKKDAKHSPLMALLPGAKIDNEKGKL
jgi:hypothetical protein